MRGLLELIGSYLSTNRYLSSLLTLISGAEVVEPHCPKK